VRDTLLTLDATNASYYMREERLEAYRNVVAVNRRTGTVLRGPNLTYLRVARGVRDTTEMHASSRPTITYRAEGDTGEPYVVVADRVRLRGDDRMWGTGKVTIDRSDLAARADSMRLDQSTGQGVLTGRPRVEGKGDRPYTIAGQRIELQLEQRTLTEVRAFERALCTSRPDTSAAADLDWIAGDTVIARFGQAADSAGKTRAELRQIVAYGSARSLTHVVDAAERGGARQPSINYSRGTRIAVMLRDERVERVTVAGGADGLHLERLPPPPPRPTDSGKTR
jgi:hypothetical protein